MPAAGPCGPGLSGWNPVPKIALYHLFPFFTMAADTEMEPSTAAASTEDGSPANKPRGAELAPFTDE